MTELEALQLRVDQLEEDKENLQSSIATLKDLFTSYMYAAPEMQNYWIGEIMTKFKGAEEL